MSRLPALEKVTHMILRLREKLPTTVRSILPTTDSLASFFGSAGKVTLVASILLQPIVQPMIAAQDTALRRTSGNIRRGETHVSKSRSQQKPSTWKSKRSLGNSDDRLSWKKPLHTGLEAIHNKQPSFIAPPKSMKRAELPAELANPGSVTKSAYIEPTSGNAVVTADGRKHLADDSAKTSGKVEQATYDELVPLPLDSPQKADDITNSRRLRTDSRQSAAERRPVRQAPVRDEIRVAQNNVFGDQDFEGLPETLDESDVEAFGDNGSSADAEDDFGSTADDANSGLGDAGFGGAEIGDAEIGDDGFGDDGFGTNDNSTVDLPDPAVDDPAFGDPAYDEPAFGDQSDDASELPTPGDALRNDALKNDDLRNDDLRNDAEVNDVEVGPVRRPDFVDDGNLDHEIPVDLSAYNGRNCPQDVAVYEAATAALMNRPITAISLDITPEFRPNVGAEEMARKRDEALQNAPPREWRNRSGQVVATGYMRDFKNGQVDIESDSGEIKSIDFHSLSSADMCSVSAWWGIPTEYRVDVEPYKVRDWTTQTFTWKASGLCHKPLYFEEVQLERYGHSAGPVKQTMLSGVHFFGNLIFLPYKMGVHPPNECQYALGYYRPGDCAPWLLHAIPLSARGARLQTAAMLGGIGLVP
ncbi:hypothetical protein ACFL2H_11010 [Planctomycetota bacterium]